jgi:hypothetical protein
MADARRKLISLFEFLKDFNALKNPVVRSLQDQKYSIRLADAPQHPSIRLWSESDDISPILRVARPNTSRGPDVPPRLKDWILYDPTTLVEPEYQLSRNISKSGGKMETVRFELQFDLCNSTLIYAVHCG